MMRAIVLCLWLALPGAAIAQAREAAPLADDPAIEARLEKMAEELRCLVCQNESLAGSRAELAVDLRREIRDMMRAGKSDKEIIDFLTARYGDFVLYRPPVKSTTLLLWGGPFLLLAVGAAVMVVYLRRRRARAQDADQALSADEERRAAALLGEGGEGKS